MKTLMERLERLLELGGIKKDATLLVLSGGAVLASLLGAVSGLYDKFLMASPENNKLDVAYVAQLARLELDPGSVAALQRDMEAIVDYINELSELDVSGIQPTAHAMEQTNVWREDISRPGYAREQMLANAPAIIEEELIRVPQVLPGEGMS